MASDQAPSVITTADESEQHSVLQGRLTEKSAKLRKWENHHICVQFL
jgi:hypothetical protein